MLTCPSFRDPQIVLIWPSCRDPQIVLTCPFCRDPQIALIPLCLLLWTAVGIFRCGFWIQQLHGVPQNDLLCVDSSHSDVQSHSHSHSSQMLAALESADAPGRLWGPSLGKSGSRATHMLTDRSPIPSHIFHRWANHHRMPPLSKDAWQSSMLRLCADLCSPRCLQ